MNGAQALARALVDGGVRTIFGYPGGAIMPFYDALLDSPLRHVLTRHEQGAAFAASGAARATGAVGVCVATSGPGATNLLTGIADAFLDSVPLLAITGQVPRPLLGTDAFQEVDVFGMSLPVVKHSFVLRSADEIPAATAEALAIAEHGRPGPVVLDVPKDVLLAPCEAAAETVARRPPAPELDRRAVDEARAWIERARRPVLYAGGGIRHARMEAGFRRFVEASGIPTVTTLHAVGTLPTGHPQLLGMLGMHGTPAANHAVQDSDLLIAMGCRFDDRATGRLAGFAPEAEVLHFDVDRAELGKLRRPSLSVPGDLRRTLPRLGTPTPSIAEWRRRCAAWRDAPRAASSGEGIDVAHFLRELTARAGPRSIVTSDVGQHQMWLAQHGVFQSSHQHLSSGGLGAMGFGLPAALGAAIACPERPVVAVSGDGSFLMNVQELATLRRERLDVKVVVLDNSALGMVRQWQECFHAQRYSQIHLDDNPDFVEVARSFGIESWRLSEPSELDASLDRLLRHEGPVLLHVPIDPAANVWPLVPPQKSNHEMIHEVPR